MGWIFPVHSAQGGRANCARRSVQRSFETSSQPENLVLGIGSSSHRERCAREQKTEKTHALETEEAPLSARLSLEGGQWLGWWHGVLDVAPMFLESTQMCIITNSGSTRSTRTVHIFVSCNKCSVPKQHPPTPQFEEWMIIHQMILTGLLI